MPEPTDTALPTVALTGVEIMRPGKWNGREYTAQDLADIVQSFHALKDEYQPPAKLGHNNKQNIIAADGLPAVGWVSNVYIQGTRLLADFIDVPKKFAQLLQAGAFKKKSAELWFNFDVNGVVYPTVLKAVAWLGADAPAVKGMSDILAMYKEDRFADIAVIAILSDAYEYSDDSFDYLRQRVQLALDEKYPIKYDPVTGTESFGGEPDGPCPMIRDLYDDRAVVTSYDGRNLWSVPFNVETDDNVTLGEPEKVKMEYTKIPAATNEEATKVGDETKNEATLAHVGQPLIAALDKFLEEAGTTAKNKKGVSQIRGLGRQLKGALGSIRWDEASNEDDEDEDETVGADGKKKPAVKAKAKAGAANSEGAMEEAEIRTLLGLADDADVKQALIQMKATQVSLTDFNAVAAEVAELREQRKTEAATALVDRAEREGKLAPAQREWALALCLSDSGAFETYMETAPKVVHLAASGGDDSANPRPENVTPMDAKVASIMGVDPNKIQELREKEGASASA